MKNKLLKLSCILSLICLNNFAFANEEVWLEVNNENIKEKSLIKLDLEENKLLYCPVENNKNSNLILSNYKLAKEKENIYNLYIEE